MSWHVLGAGAIGGLWALRLANAGFPVTLIGREHGNRTLCLHDPQQDSTDHATFTELPPSAMACGSISQLLVCTKAHQTLHALQALLPALKADADIVLLQNGMGVQETLADWLPQAFLHIAITTDGVFRKDRDHLVLAGRGDTWLGNPEPRQLARAQALCQALQAQQLPVQWADNIRERQWQKLAVNCAINPLTVQFHCRNGELLLKPEALKLMRQVCMELADVMQAEGLSADGHDLFRQATLVAARTSANTSSMLADVQAGRDTEIDCMNGYVVMRAKQHGLACEANTGLWQALRQQPV